MRFRYCEAGFPLLLGTDGYLKGGWPQELLKACPHPTQSFSDTVPLPTFNSCIMHDIQFVRSSGDQWSDDDSLIVNAWTVNVLVGSNGCMGFEYSN